MGTCTRESGSSAAALPGNVTDRILSAWGHVQGAATVALQDKIQKRRGGVGRRATGPGRSLGRRISVDAGAAATRDPSAAGGGLRAGLRAHRATDCAAFARIDQQPIDGWNRWCMAHIRPNESLAALEDKAASKGLMRRVAPHLKLPATYFLASQPAAINRSVVAALPAAYVMKGTAASGQTTIGHDGTLRCYGYYCPPSDASCVACSLDAQVAFLQRVCRTWQRVRYGAITKQRRFRRIAAQCIFEEFVPFNDDYKVFTFGGAPILVQVDTRRYSGHGRGYFTPRWQPLQLKERHYRKANFRSYDYARPGQIAEPIALQTMTRAAASISTQLGLQMLRVDFYTAVDGALWLGELTPSHDNCLSRYMPDIAAKWFSFAATHPAEVAKDPNYADRIVDLLQASEDGACTQARMQ